MTVFRINRFPKRILAFTSIGIALLDSVIIPYEEIGLLRVRHHYES